jgi:twitching motility two-component system response regulator PilH
MAVSKVMVVDDSSSDRRNLEGIVRDAGYAVITAASGQEAIDVASRELPDVILLDVVMDDVDGFKACRILKEREQTRGIPIIFVTSKTQKADRRWAELQGAQGFISKPYTPDQILDEIRRL